MYKFYVYIYTAAKIASTKSNPAVITTTASAMNLSPNKRTNAVITANPKISNAFVPDFCNVSPIVLIKSKDMFPPPFDLVSVHLPLSQELEV